MDQGQQLSPAVLKIVLGSELARQRKLAGLMQEQVAARLGWPQQKVARIEKDSGVRADELEALLGLYSASEVDRAYTRDLQAESGRRRKKGTFSTRFPQYLRLLVDMEPTCHRYFAYQALVIPGLLQTEDYMRRNARAWRPSLEPEAIDQYTADRLERQRALDDAQRQFWFIIDEAALRRGASGPDMRHQLTKLVDTIDRPNVELQVVPFSAGYYMGQGHDYTIFGFDTKPAVDIIYLEQHIGGDYVVGPEATKSYRTLWDYQKAAASGPEQTRQTLLDIANSL
ncbi:helix-turn-helix transcriptional regulator [Allokutzneria multivorans]|uniref:Helix-turn-helix transcriptional regulator n=1 Tax=Allokutzneria multivorans TaxID=1142134 RepID=A0ABP7SE85_9PSEU